MKKTILAILALILAALGGSQVANLGGSPGNLPASLATSSTVAVGPDTISVLFPPSPNKICSARIVSTKTEPILIHMDNTATSTLLNLTAGLLQAASTTVLYGAEDFGCEDWIVRDVGSGASTTITIVETR